MGKSVLLCLLCYCSEQLSEYEFIFFCRCRCIRFFTHFYIFCLKNETLKNFYYGVVIRMLTINISSHWVIGAEAAFYLCSIAIAENVDKMNVNCYNNICRS